MTAGTTSNTPLPRVGDILNYVFLFDRESRERDEGLKERPCMVFSVNAETRLVKVLPLTTKGDRYVGTLQLPQEVAQKANLRYPTAVVVTEANAFTWLGFDLRPLVSSGNSLIGRMPPGFTAKIMAAARSPTEVDRD